MPVVTVMSGDRQVQIDYTEVPAYTTTNDYAAVPGSTVDARGWDVIAVTVPVSTNAVKWYLRAANKADFSDNVAESTELTTAAGAVGKYSTLFAAAYAFYRLEAKSSVADTHGSITATIIAKEV
jgi:hypothetical protein